MEIRLLSLYRFILLAQHLVFGFVVLASSHAEASRNDSLAPFVASHRGISGYDRMKLANLREAYSNEFRRRRIKERFLWNWQNTTTLQRFNATGSVDDDLRPRISRYTSVEWLAKESGFNPKIRTVFVLHGFMSLSLAQQSWANGIRNLIYRWTNSANMFFVDWNHKAKIPYPIYYGALVGAMEVAEDLKQIINNLSSAFPEWDSSNIHLIGHSLGSHIAGRLGFLMDNAVMQISAMGSFVRNSPIFHFS